jgi:hypothetical protein
MESVLLKGMLNMSPFHSTKIWMSIQWIPMPSASFAENGLRGVLLEDLLVLIFTYYVLGM